jgi:hypothetical protein
MYEDSKYTVYKQTLEGEGGCFVNQGVYVFSSHVWAIAITFFGGVVVVIVW